MSKRLFGSAVLAAAVLALPLVRAADEKKAGKGIDDDGFIKAWVVFAPIPLAEGEEAGAAVDKQQLKDEAKLEPKDGDKAKAGEKELAWKAVTTETHLLDFNAVLGGQTERSVGYAVAYVESAAEVTGVSLKVGSDDGCKVYLNGKEVGKHTDDRAADKDQDTFDGLTLKKGTNVVVFKVVNNLIDWSGCARFTDKDGKPVGGLTADAKAAKKDEK